MLKLIHICLIVFFSAGPSNVCGHGRLLEPPNRSSIWRFEEFAHLPRIENFNDNELFCGGFTNQHDKHGGECGPCGDAYQDPRPRSNENGGLYGQGIIVRNYTQGQEIPIHVELTASHKGYFEFSLCPLKGNLELEEESCFDQNILKLKDGSTRYPVPTYEAGHYRTVVKLPDQLTCSHCILRWHYNAGNRWGKCENGTTVLGCGPQETFRGCADVGIY